VKRKLLNVAAMSALYPALYPLLHASVASAQIGSIYDASDAAGYYSGLSGTVSQVLTNVATATTTTFTVTDYNPNDETASVICYAIPKTTYTPVVGQNISFGAYNSPYQDAPELIYGNASNGFFTVTPGTLGNPTPISTLTIPQALAGGDGSSQAFDPTSESIVTLDNVYFNSSIASLATASNTTYYINDGVGDSMTIYDYKSYTSVVAGAQAANAANPGGFSSSEPVDITGYVDVYFGTPEIYPLSIVAVPEPTSLGLLGMASVALLRRRRRPV
jgi:hypothetical protein